MNKPRTVESDRFEPHDFGCPNCPEINQPTR
jgi:hypothetical protein